MSKDNQTVNEQLYDIVQTDHTDGLVKILTTKALSFQTCEELVERSNLKRLMIVSELDLSQNPEYRSPWDAPPTIH